MTEVEVLRVSPPNPAHAPKMPGRCEVCRSVTDLTDVNLRLWLADGTRQPGGLLEATEYLMGIGQPGNDHAVRRRIKTHMRHVEAFLENPHPVAPISMTGITRLADREDVKFPTVQQKSLNLGSLAMDQLMVRIESGIVEDETLVTAAKIGSATADRKAAMAAKGADEKLDMLQRMLSGAAE